MSAVEPPNIENPICIEKLFDVLAVGPGLWYTLVKPGTYVSAGMKPGTITDYVGKVIAEPRAPVSAVVLHVNAVPSLKKGRQYRRPGRPRGPRSLNCTASRCDRMGAPGIRRALMPISIEGRQDGAGVIYHCHGDMTIDDFFQAGIGFLAFPDGVKKWRYAIIDLTSVGAMKINSADIRTVVEQNKRIAAIAHARPLLAAAPGIPQCFPFPCRPFPPLSGSICPYESGIAPSPRSAAAPDACHPSAVSGRPPGRSAAHIPGKAFPASSCSARPSPTIHLLRISIPFPASRRTSSPSSARSPFDSRCALSRRTPLPTVGQPQAHVFSYTYGSSPFSSYIRGPTCSENNATLLLCPLPKPHRIPHRPSPSLAPRAELAVHVHGEILVTNHCYGPQANLHFTFCPCGNG